MPEEEEEDEDELEPVSVELEPVIIRALAALGLRWDESAEVVAAMRKALTIEGILDALYSEATTPHRQQVADILRRLPEQDLQVLSEVTDAYYAEPDEPAPAFPVDSAYDPYTAVYDSYMPAMFCGHANESPTRPCDCPRNCACRETMCSSGAVPTQVTLDMTGFDVETIVRAANQALQGYFGKSPEEAPEIPEIPEIRTPWIELLQEDEEE